MDILFEWVGFGAIALSVLAYFPQIIHLIKERCSAGLSVAAYCAWGVAAAMLLIYSISRRDMVFVVLQTYNLAATTLIFIFCLKYRGSLCEFHGGRASALQTDKKTAVRE